MCRSTVIALVGIVAAASSGCEVDLIRVGAMRDGGSGDATGPDAAPPDLVIDDFTDPFPPETFVVSGTPIETRALEVGRLPDNATRATESASQLDLRGVLGGRRDAKLSTSDALSGDTTGEVGNGQLTFSVGGGEGLLETSYAGAAGLKVNLGASRAFLLERASTDSFARVAITLTSRAGTADERVETQTAAVFNGGSATVPFERFTTIDFTQVDRIAVAYAAAAGADLSVGTFRVVAY